MRLIMASATLCPNAETGNDTARAADLLGVGFRVLIAKMRAYDLGTQ